MMTPFPVLRVARPTDDFEGTLRFYRDGLGMEVLSRFDDHQGFDGVMIGWRGSPYHFEFTHKRGHPVPRAPSEDNLVVLYLADADVYGAAVARMTAAGFAPVPAFNPYWDRDGVTFEDPEGYRVVLYLGGGEELAPALTLLPRCLQMLQAVIVSPMDTLELGLTAVNCDRGASLSSDSVRHEVG